MRRVIVVYNSFAGLQRRPDISRQILEYLGDHRSAELVKVAPKDLQHGQVAELLDDGIDLVIAVGGDGTVMACASALQGRSIPLAIIPYGTGNMIAKNLGIPSSVTRALDVSVRGVRRMIDVGEVEGGHFVMATAIGVQADFFAHASIVAKANVGIAAYGMAALSTLRARPDIFTLMLDDHRSIEIAAYGIAVGDLSRFHSVRRRWPEATPDDGKFEIVALKRHPALSAVAPIDRFVANWFQSETVEIHSKREHLVMLDGETPGSKNGIVVACHRRALTVCVPEERLLRPWRTPLSVLRNA